MVLRHPAPVAGKPLGTLHGPPAVFRARTTLCNPRACLLGHTPHGPPDNITYFMELHTLLLYKDLYACTPLTRQSDSPDTLWGGRSDEEEQKLDGTHSPVQSQTYLVACLARSCSLR